MASAWGYLAKAGFGERMREPQREFAKRQARVFAWVAVIGLSLSLMISALTANYLARRIRRLSSASAAFAQRDFSTRAVDGGRDELGQLAEDFNSMAEALSRYEQRQRQWLADAAHELRTPLAVLRGELEALLDGVRHADEQALRSLQEETQRLTMLVDDLNLLSLAESGSLNLHLQNYELGELMAAAQQRLAVPMSMSGFQLKTIAAPALTVRVDRARFEQVLGNLLNNVLRHADPGEVTLAHGQSGNRAWCRVSDAGPGVDAAHRERLFDRLYQAEHDRNQQHPGKRGSGLGLAICKGIIEAHGGRIYAQAAPSGGLQITIELKVNHEHSDPDR